MNPGHRVDHRRAGALVRNVGEVGLRRELEQLHSEVGRRADSGAAVAQGARARVRQRHQFLRGARGERWMRPEHQGHHADQACRREILARIVGKLGIDAVVDGLRGQALDEHRVAVGGGGRGEARSQRGARPAAEVDDELLPDQFTHARRDGARHELAGAAGSKTHDHADRLGRVGLGGGVHGVERQKAAPASRPRCSRNLPAIRIVTSGRQSGSLEVNAPILCRPGRDPCRSSERACDPAHR